MPSSASSSIGARPVMFSPLLPMPFPSSVPFPVLVPLPCLPVLSDISMRDVPMSGGDMAEIGWHIDYGTRHSFGGEVNPLSIVGFGSIPMSSMRTIPVTLVEKDIHVHVRGKVDIGPGDDEHGGGCRDHKGGWRRHANPDIDVHFRKASIEGAHQRQKRRSNK